MVLEKKQVICILINILCIKMIMTYPRIIIQAMGNAAWINIIYVTILALLLFRIITGVYNSDYGDYINAAEKAGGKLLKRITGIIFAVILIMNISYTVRSYPETVKTVLLVETKMQLIVMMFIAAAAIGAYFGIENNARIQAIFMPVAGVVLAGFCLLSIPYWNINNIMPILGKGAGAIFGKGALGISLFSDIVVLNFLMPYIKAKRDIKSSGYTAIVISGIISILIVGTYNLIYPFPVSADFILPAYQISRIVKFGMFFQRWEAFFQFVWSIGMYLYTSLYISVISEIIASAFDLKFYRPLIFPVSIIVGSSAFMINMQNSSDIIIFSAFAMIVITFCVPILYGVILRIKSTIKNRY